MSGPLVGNFWFMDFVLLVSSNTRIYVFTSFFFNIPIFAGNFLTFLWVPSNFNVLCFLYLCFISVLFPISVLWLGCFKCISSHPGNLFSVHMLFNVMIIACNCWALIMGQTLYYNTKTHTISINTPHLKRRKLRHKKRWK